MILTMILSAALAGDRDAGYVDTMIAIESIVAEREREKSDPRSYAHNYARSREDGKLIVLVSDEGCIPCREMKSKMDRLGVRYAVVDMSDPIADEFGDPRRGVPRLHYRWRSGRQWFERNLVGDMSDGSLRVALGMGDPMKGEKRLPGPSHGYHCEMCLRNDLLGRGVRDAWQMPFDRAKTIYDNVRNRSWKGAVRSPRGTTPADVIEDAIDLLNLEPADRFVDIGSGTGKVVHAVARRGVPAHGIDIDSDLVVESRRAGEPLATFSVEDATAADLSRFTAAYAYFSPADSLLPAIRSMPDGGRVVFHEFPLDEFAPAKIVDSGRSKLYLYELPLMKPAVTNFTFTRIEE